MNNMDNQQPKSLEEILQGVEELEKEIAEFEKTMPKWVKKMAESEYFPLKH